MITIELTDDEGKVLRNVLENYLTHLRIEIVGTYRKEFRDALKEREKTLLDLVGRLEKAT